VEDAEAEGGFLLARAFALEVEGEVCRQAMPCEAFQARHFLGRVFHYRLNLSLGSSVSSASLVISITAESHSDNFTRGECGSKK
jgi:hypothetical protein